MYLENRQEGSDVSEKEIEQIFQNTFMTKDQSSVQNVVKNLIGVIKMHDKNEDAAQAEFCRQ